MYRFPIQVSQHKESSTPLAAGSKKGNNLCKIARGFMSKRGAIQPWHTGWDLAKNRKIPQKSQRQKNS